MAKNIDFMGATFPDVPSIRLPQHEGGLVSFTDVTDTTAVASDVANGKYFYTADGEKTVGTASGGITPSGTIQITQNGQVDVTNYATADVNVSGGGASNFVTGTFSHSVSGSTTQTLTVPYTGSGYPIMTVIVVDGGMYKSGTDWYNSVDRYAVGFYAITKSNFSTDPNYSRTSDNNRGVVSVIYKNSTSSATNYATAQSTTSTAYGTGDPSTSSTGLLRWSSNTTLKYKTRNSSNYGLLKDTTYRYFIVYSE